jgi:hypothetical protein
MDDDRREKRRKKTDTARQKTKRACARHLLDLKKAHAHPPADVALKRVAIPKRLDPVPTNSWCTSPGQLCAELAE